ncbi:hypothetical protein ABFP60_15355 [Clostridioides difficile]
MLSMEQIRTEIRKCKKQKSLWEKDTTSWNSSLKVDELNNRIKELEDQLYEMEFKELEEEEKNQGLQG